MLMIAAAGDGVVMLHDLNDTVVAAVLALEYYRLYFHLIVKE